MDLLSILGILGVCCWHLLNPPCRQRSRRQLYFERHRPITLPPSEPAPSKAVFEAAPRAHTQTRAELWQVRCALSRRRPPAPG